MINYDDYANENKTEHNLNWPYIPDLINDEPDIDKAYPYAKDPYEVKYQYLINVREQAGLNDYDDPKSFMEYSNDMQDVYINIEEYNQGKKRKELIFFDDTIADMINNKKTKSNSNRTVCST